MIYNPLLYFKIECDNCGEELETVTDNFYDAVEIAKQEDWIIRKVKDEWLHFCNEECKNEYLY